MIICEKCHVGRLRPTHADYIRFQEGRAIVAPQVAALSCDTCRRLVFDPAYLDHLAALLSGPASSGRLPARFFAPLMSG